MPARVSSGQPFALTGAARERLVKHLGRAVARARKAGEGLAAVSFDVGSEIDPTAVVVASRAGGEPWFVLEQPDRDRTALATLGVAAVLEASGPERFAVVAARWRALLEGGSFDGPAGPRGSGPVVVGGFAFADEGGGAPHWRGFAPASLVLPEVALARRGAEVVMTLAAVATPDDTADELLARLEARAASLVQRELPLYDPDPVTRSRVVSAMPPEHYEGAVARAVEQIRAGRFEKVVLAREVQVHATAAHDPAPALGVLREAFPQCYVFAVGRGSSTFLAASPELLVRRDGLRAGTLALAGSTRRSADPAVDDHLGEQLLRSPKDRGEQLIVTRRITRRLRPHAVWVTAAEEPVVVKMANIQHLATPIRAQLREPISAIELAARLHPTPAVGGEPLDVAGPEIPRLEGLDRGWYAGPVGWSDANEDGEFCVALRCALLTGAVARCYAGVGVVGDSTPEAELAETEIKLQALLPILAS